MRGVLACSPCVRHKVRTAVVRLHTYGRDTLRRCGPSQSACKAHSTNARAKLGPGRYGSRGGTDDPVATHLTKLTTIYIYISKRLALASWKPCPRYLGRLRFAAGTADPHTERREDAAQHERTQQQLAQSAQHGDSNDLQAALAALFAHELDEGLPRRAGRAVRRDEECPLRAHVHLRREAGLHRGVCPELAVERDVLTHTLGGCGGVVARAGEAKLLEAK
eukprot:scaffold60060_cov53-Phaeocystis_antarctica.AAC.4